MTTYEIQLKGDFKTLLKFFLPILLMMLMGNITIFIEKILFGYLSPEILTASVDVNFIARIFQVTFVYLASLTQVYVGEWYGAREYEKIGPVVWQLIWFSFLSLLITIPAGFLVGQYYFQGTPFAEVAMPYLYAYIGMNFLYPLKATLTGFYLGIGKAAWVTRWMIGGECLQLLLNLIFILGIPPWIPSFGLLGGALSNFIVQSGLCIFLLVHFLFPHIRLSFHTNSWRWEPLLFWKLIKPGFFRAMTQTLQATSWAAISYIITQQGSPYTTVLSVGVTVFYFLACFGSSFQITMMTLNAQFIGAGVFHLIKKSLQSIHILLLIFFIPLCIPLFFFSENVLQFLFPHVVFDTYILRFILKSVWVCLLTFSITSITSGVILAFKDTRFLLLTGLWSWVFDFGICTFLAIQILHIPSTYFWIMISLGHLLITCLYYWRIQQLQQQANFAPKVSAMKVSLKEQG